MKGFALGALYICKHHNEKFQNENNLASINKSVSKHFLIMILVKYQWFKPTENISPFHKLVKGYLCKIGQILET